MKILLLDDEPLILSHQKEIIEKNPDVDLVYTLSNTEEIVSVVGRFLPHLIFVEFEMPGQSGIKLAKEIKMQFPHVGIVFLTAYSEYALESYEVDALDYLVKPLTQENVESVLHRYQSRTETTVSKSFGRLRLLGGLDFELPSSEIVAVKWRTTKAREVFCYLVHNRRRLVYKDVLLDEFWPTPHKGKRSDQLYATIYSIRKTLDSLPFSIRIENQRDGYILHDMDVVIDAEQFEQGLKVLQPHQLEGALSLYRGEYLKGSGGVWVENERERIKTIWLEKMYKLVEHYVKNGRLTEAITLHLKVQDLCPYEEEVYFELMKLYAEKKERFLVEKQYERLSMMLADEYASLPAKHVTDWYLSWKKSI